MEITEEAFKKQFGRRIRELRKSKKLTQEKLAELVWIDTQHLCKMENGNHFPSLKNLLRLANALDVKVIDLFNYNETKKENLLRNIDLQLNNKLSYKELEFVNNIINSLLKLRDK